MVHIHFICKHVRAFVRILIATSCIVYLLSWFKIQRPDVSIRGSLNIHRWDSLCGFTVDDLRSHEFFPNRPNWKSFVYGLESTVSSTNIGQRIFGYIQAPTSGHYQFSISSDDFSELWLSSNENPNNASLICHIGGRDEEKGTFVFGWTGPSEFNKYESQMSRRIHLKEGK